MSLYSWIKSYKYGNPDKDSSYMNTMNEDERKICLMIGILAADIRSHWNDIDDRLNAIKKLCKKLGKKNWLKQIDENVDKIYEDGKWFRDTWDGPYNDQICTPEDVGETLYKEYVQYLNCLI